MPKYSLYSEIGSFEEFSTCFKKYLYSEELSDVKFVIGDINIPAHKLIISSRCPGLMVSEEPEIIITDMNEITLK